MTEDKFSLYLVATPIGNLGDMSFRAIEILKHVDIVASEDTRKTGLLLKHFEIKKRLISFFEHNEEKAIAQILHFIQVENKKVALVTSAGTPGISDPGFRLVREAIHAGIQFSMVPGPTGLVMALVLSGLPTHSFTFRGFPPRKSGPRTRFFTVDSASPHTLIFYESPYRLLDSLKDAMEVFGDRPASIANDLTKLFETMYRGRLSELIERIGAEKQQGEYIIIIEGKQSENASATTKKISDALLPDEDED